MYMNVIRAEWCVLATNATVKHDRRHNTHAVFVHPRVACVKNVAGAHIIDSDSSGPADRVVYRARLIRAICHLESPVRAMRSRFSPIHESSSNHGRERVYSSTFVLSQAP